MTGRYRGSRGWLNCGRLCMKPSYQHRVKSLVLIEPREFCTQLVQEGRRLSFLLVAPDPEEDIQKELLRESSTNGWTRLLQGKYLPLIFLVPLSSYQRSTHHSEANALYGKK